MNSFNNSLKSATFRYVLHLVCIIIGFWIGVNISFSYRLFSIKWQQEEVFGDNVPHDEKVKWIQNVQKSMADNLDKTIKLLCLVIQRNEPERRSAIMDTWGRRCNRIIFVIGNANAENTVTTVGLTKNAELVTLKMADKYKYLWLKTKLAFKFVLDKYKLDYDWVLKADDDTFVIVENLKLFLSDKNVQSKFFYGFQFKEKAPKGYNSGGSGYAMSMFNAQKLYNSFSMKDCYQGDDEPEDVNVARCLALMDVYPGDTRDIHGRFRFIMSHINGFLWPGSTVDKAEWFSNYSMYSVKDGYECCSDSAISFHQITTGEIRTIEYLIYYVQPFGSRNIWKSKHV